MKNWFLILLFIPTVSYCQQSKLDSLNRNIERAKTDNDKALAYLDIANFVVSEQQIKFDATEIIDYLEQANLLADEDHTIITSGVALSSAELTINKSEQALQRLFNLKSKYKGSNIKINNKIIDKILYYNDTRYNSQSDLIQFLLVLSELWEVTGNEQMLSYLYQRIGYQFRVQGLYQRALQYFHKAIDISIKYEDTYVQQWTTYYVGSTYRRMKDYKNSIVWNNKSLDLARKLPDCQVIGSPLNELGKTYYALGDYNKALELQYQSLLEKRKVNQKRWGQSWATIEIARNYLALGNLDSAIHYGNVSLEYAETSGEISIEMRDAKKIMSEILIAQKQYKKALELSLESKIIGDSLVNTDFTEELVSGVLEHSFKRERKLEKEVQKRKDELQEQRVYQRNIVLIAVIVFSIVLILFLLSIWLRLRTTKKHKEYVEQQHFILGKKNEEILDSITYAKRIQSAILPPNKVVKEYLQESFIYYKPKDIVAGDFYWLESVPGLSDNDAQKILFAAADCTGHGVPGAMVSVVCNNGLNRSVREYGLTDPAEILNKTREIVIQEFEKSEEEVKDGMDIALCSLEDNKLKYAGAHNPLWIIRDGELLETKANKQPIGQFDNPEPYTTHAIELQKGDSLYIFSDGYADQFGGDKGKKLKTANFKKLLLSIQKETMEKQKQLIDEAFEKWKGNLEQLDDVCVIGVRI